MAEDSNHISRRHFLKAAAAIPAAVMMPAVVPASALGRGREAPSQKINVGIIGVGYQAHGHLNNLIRNSDVHVLAVCDVDKTRRDDAKKIADTWYEDDIAKGTYK